VKVQLQSRVLDSKLSDDIWQDLRDDRRYEANSQLANITLLGAMSDAERSLSLIERSLGLREKQSTDLRQTHRPPVSDKELNTEFVFKGLDLAAESRLDDVESLGSATEIRFLGQCNERPEVAKLHHSLLSLRMISLRNRFYLTTHAPSKSNEPSSHQG